MYIFKYLYCFFVFGVQYICAQQVCVDKYNECTAITSQMSVHIESTAFTAVVPPMNDTSLENACSLYESGDACHVELSQMAECLAFAPYYFNQYGYYGWNDSWYFTCNEGKPGYIDHRDCLITEEVTNGDLVCYDAYNQTLYDLYNLSNYYYHYYYYYYYYYCLHIDTYLDCVENSTTHLCGSDPGLWLRVMYTKNLESRYLQVGCYLDTSGYVHFTTTTTTSTTTPTTTSTTTSTTNTTSSTPTTASQGNSDSSVTNNSPHTGIIVGCTVALALLIIAVLAAVIITYKEDEVKATNFH